VWPPVQEAAALVGRLLLAALFLHEAWSKVTDYAAAVTYAQAFGVPGLLIPAAIALESACAVLILIGYQARVAAVLLAGFCLATAVLFHTRFANRNELLHFEKDLAIAGGLLVLFARGAGAWAFDALRMGGRRADDGKLISEKRLARKKGSPNGPFRICILP
jgi:putative oxidoreductase